MAPILVSSVSEFVQRAEMGRRPAQDIDEGLLGVLPPVEGAEQNRALDFGFDGLAPAALMRQHILKLAQPRFPRNAGRPVAIAAGQVTQGIVMQGSRVLFQSGHEARKVKRGAFNRATIG